MGERVQPLIDAAKLLSTEERAELLDELLQIDGNFEADMADTAEWTRRFNEFEAGSVEGVDAEDVIASARADLKNRRRT